MPLLGFSLLCSADTVLLSLLSVSSGSTLFGFVVSGHMVLGWFVVVSVTTKPISGVSSRIVSMLGFSVASDSVLFSVFIFAICADFCNGSVVTGN